MNKINWCFSEETYWMGYFSLKWESPEFQFKSINLSLMQWLPSSSIRFKVWLPFYFACRYHHAKPKWNIITVVNKVTYFLSLTTIINLNEQNIWDLMVMDISLEERKKVLENSGGQTLGIYEGYFLEISPQCQVSQFFLWWINIPLVEDLGA